MTTTIGQGRRPPKRQRQRWPCGTLVKSNWVLLGLGVTTLLADVYGNWTLQQRLLQRQEEEENNIGSLSSWTLDARPSPLVVAAKPTPSITVGDANATEANTTTTRHPSSSNDFHQHHDDNDPANYTHTKFFSACLIVMDEQHRLPEWMAYHYFALPLRHLILLVDPRSRQQRQLDALVTKWRPYMTIQVWGDKDIRFRPEQHDKYYQQRRRQAMQKNSKHKTKNMTQQQQQDDYEAQITAEHLTKIHRKRQAQFYQVCATYLRLQYHNADNNTNHNNIDTWTAFFDVDEYLYLDDEESMLMEKESTIQEKDDEGHSTTTTSIITPSIAKRRTQPGHIAQFLQDLHDCVVHHNKNDTTTNTQNEALAVSDNPNKCSISSPALQRYGALAYQRSCIVAARTYFGTTPSPPNVTRNKVPSYLLMDDTTRANNNNQSSFSFETLTWLHRPRHQDPRGFGKGKSIVHVTAPTYHMDESHNNSSHNNNILPFRPIINGHEGIHLLLTTCHDASYTFSPLRLRHYVGSWQGYRSRTADARAGLKRNRQLWEYRAELGHDRPRDDALRDWLPGFAQLLDDNATLVRYLLQGAGQIEPSEDHSSSNHSEQEDEQRWSLSHEQIQALIHSSRRSRRSAVANNYAGNRHFIHWLKQRYGDNSTNTTTTSSGEQTKI